MTPSTTRLLAKTTKLPSSSASSILTSIHPRGRPHHQSLRAFSQTSQTHQDDRPPPPRPESLLSRLSSNINNARPPTPQRPPQTAAPRDGMSDLKRVLATNVLSRALPIGSTNILSDNGEGEDEAGGAMGPRGEPFHFHILAHKHNTHITVTRPDRGAIISLSAGNIGFRKAKRGSYDAAYQLCAYVIDKLNQGGWHRKITALEVVLSGFGQGREAVTKVLLGGEGRLLRPHIRMVSDATKLKFGGTRSPNPRRLG